VGKVEKIKIGDSVVVKDGIMCPDMESFSIAGWQGRVLEISDDGEEGTSVEFELDSITLRTLTEDYIRDSEEKGLDWTGMVLLIDEVELSKPRDTEDDVESVVEELSSLHAWDFLGEQGVRIASALKGIDPDDDYACMKAWGRYLKKVLVFPFDARISEDDEEEGPLKIGDLISVRGIDIVDDLYGVIVNVTFGKRKYDHPLCNIEALDKKSPNYQNVYDYVVWFANR
jgi:hypothetical protein